MPAPRPVAPSAEQLRAFQDRNPELDLLDFPFLDRAAVSALDWGDADSDALLPTAMAWQRVLRLGASEELAASMLDRGYDSAHAVARLPAWQFAEAMRDVADDRELREVHQVASQTKSRAQHLWANLHGSLFSPHYRGTRFANFAEFADSSGLPTYRDLFGSLSYASCDHCRSIFGPAAYLVDLLRIVDEYVTARNPGIPPGMRLSERRPDIERIYLTCANTDTVIDYLGVVNEVLCERLRAEWHVDDVYRAVATAVYPNTLPFSSPLSEIRLTVATLDTSLADVYAAVAAPPSSPGAPGTPTEFEVNRERLGLSAQQYEIVARPVVDPDALAERYGVSADQLLPSSRTATGTAAVTAGTTAVTGTGTRFLAEVPVGSQVQVGDDVRTVLAVASDVELSVDGAWRTSADGALIVLRVDNLQTAVFFTYQTALDWEGLTALIDQRLGEEEIEAGLSKGFFINQGGSTPLGLSVDSRDPYASVRILTPLTLANLDRLDRFLRLSRYSGISAADLDWGMRVSGATQIDAAAIDGLAAISRVASAFDIGIPEATALFADMKTIGVADPATPRDLFDRTFNSDTILGIGPGQLPAFTATGRVSIQQGGDTVAGDAATRFVSQIAVGERIRIGDDVRVVRTVADRLLGVEGTWSISATDTTLVSYPDPSVSDDAVPVYHPQYAANPLYTDPVLSWDIANTTADPRTRQRLLAALHVSDDDLTLLARSAIARQGLTGTTLDLTVENLTGLYSDARMAALLGLPVRDYLTLTELMGVSALTSADDVLDVRDAALWLRSNDISVYVLSYILTGKGSEYFKPAYSGDAVPQFMATLWALASPITFTPASFGSPTVDQQLSARFFDRLVAEGYITEHGAVLDSKHLGFQSVATMNPLTQTSFITTDIDDEAAKQAFADLKSHTPPLLLSDGSLSIDFTPTTDLDFLFPDDPGKVSEVRAVLVNVRSGLDYVLTLVSRVATTQLKTVIEQVAVFLGGAADLVDPLLRFAAASAGVTDLAARFLTPPQAADLTPIRRLLSGTARALTVAQTIPLTALEAREVIEHPEYFAVGDLSAPTFADLRNLTTFRSLEHAFGDTDGDLVRYFGESATSPCDESAKVAILAALTQWSPAQICAVTSTYWPDSTAYNNVVGVAFMKSLFDFAGRIGVEVTTLLSLATTSSAAGITDDTWRRLNSAASSWLSIAGARMDPESWKDVHLKLSDQLNVARRDAITAATIHALRRTHPSIRTNSDLYDYFLIDVDMAGCGETSRIAQAISSVQLYLQRCRMTLEPGVADLSEILPAWWSWLSAYRLWEVNRKIFLYPENYLDPAVSDANTPLFDELVDALTANEVTETSATDTYRTYLDRLCELGDLRYIDSFRGPMADPRTGRSLDTLFVVGRSPERPFTYYWRTWAPASGMPWSAWRKIDLTVNAASVTSVVVLNRPYLFWSELESTGVSSFSDNQNANAVATRVRLQYTFADSAGLWKVPQTLADIPIGFTPPGYSTQQVNPADFDFSAPEWAKPLVYPVQGTTIADWTILVLYGGFYALPTGEPKRPVKPAPTASWTQDQTELAERVYRSSASAVTSAQAGNSGQTFVNLAYAMDSLLVASTTNVNVLDSSTIPDLPLPYLAYRDDTAGTLSVAHARDLFLIPYWTSRPQVRPGYPLLHNIASTGGSILSTASQVGWFIYDNGDESFLVRSREPGLKQTVDAMRLRTGTPDEDGRHANLLGLAYTPTPEPLDQVKFQFTRLSTGALPRMRQALLAGGIPRLLSPATQRSPQLPLFPFSRFYDGTTPPTNTLPPPIPDGDALDYDGPYGAYFWEVFFRIPFLIGDQLRANRRFEDAKAWYDYVFDPTAAPEEGVAAPNDRYWRFLHFRDVSVPSVVASLSDPVQIQRYNDDPFDPDAIARLRPSAYQKAIVMRYIDNLIEWGDSLFAVDTAESVNQATLLYVLARDLLGPRPTNLGELDAEPPATYQDIRDAYHGDIPQFLIRIEHALGSYPPPPTQASDPYVPFNDLHTYFGIPENQEFIGYWDRVDDRLTKIRNCRNIQGERRTLPLFAPPLDPRAVVKAAAAGQDGLAVAPQRQPVFPPYRFSVVLGLAKDLASQLASLGSSLLSAIERQDANHLALVRQVQELAVLNLSTVVREKQLEELTATRAALRKVLDNARYRVTHFQELMDNGLSPAEVMNIAMMVLSNVSTMASSAVRGVSSALHLVPNVGSPFAMTYGGRQLGPSVEAAATVLDAAGAYSNMLSNLSLTAAGYERRAEDWLHQLNLATFDVDQCTQQLAAVDAQIAGAQRQLEIHLRSIEQSSEIETYLRRRFGNEQLYQWMTARISVVLFQTYLVALDMALSAQLAYQFELSTDDTFVSFEYWDSLKRGLLSGEQLMLSLNQMQAAYVQANSRALEIQKTVSLFQTDPRALLALRTDGVCEFDLGEALYDVDFPGHYNRKIKTVSVTIPALVGPYQNVKATLVQKSNSVLLRPNVDAVRTLLGISSAPPPSGTIRSNWRSNQDIAISRGVNDSGVFDVSPNDERYLPFEGTGAVSGWRLELPRYANLIDYESISDVLVTVSYTATDGGAEFRNAVITLLDGMPTTFMRPVLTASEFPAAWHEFMNPGRDPERQTLIFDLGARTFPPNLSSRKLVKLYAQLVLADGVELGGAFTTTLSIGAGPPMREFPLTFTDTANPSVSNVDIIDFIDVPWVLTVNLSATNPPPGIRTPATGLLDPAKLHGIALIATYTAKRQWH